MEKETIKQSLIDLQYNDDTEIAHIQADNILCQFLKELGYEDIVEEYDKIDKWYV
ncbi:hypothetical protein [Sphingobacterium sp.]|uniref:hypothetical protein n=1 Tax=Sphingobacterium sp. TaxID=341027 RepID=UPI0028AFD8B0|nr:hypothetical protein [Sphingobacterium sp.]